MVTKVPNKIPLGCLESRRRCWVMVRKLVLLVCFLVLVGAGTESYANIITVNTGLNPGVGDGPVNAQGVFTTSAGQVQIVLTNLFQNPTAAGQLISGVTFTVSGG